LSRSVCEALNCFGEWPRAGGKRDALQTFSFSRPAIGVGRKLIAMNSLIQKQCLHGLGCHPFRYLSGSCATGNGKPPPARSPKGAGALPETPLMPARTYRIEPAARSTARMAGKRHEKCPGTPPKGRPGAGQLHQAVVVNSRITVLLNVALTISRAVPTAMKPTSARTHHPTKTSERIPNTIAAIPIRISIPLAAAEP